jgi:hypothetical protein
MAITCCEFEQKWNERLDAIAAQSDGGMSGSERVVLAHAAECIACREKGAKYEALRSAILAWGPPPPAPDGLVDHILAELEATATTVRPVARVQVRTARWAGARPLIAAAAVAACLLTLVVLDRVKPHGPTAVFRPAAVDERHEQRTESPTGPVDYRALNTALADVTAATLDLARAASEPAARIGRQVIDAAARPDPAASETEPAGEPDSIALVVSVPSLNALAPNPAAAAAMWHQVGDGLADGVRPLTSTARHAFGFLLGPAQPKPELRSTPPADKGA